MTFAISQNTIETEQILRDYPRARDDKGYFLFIYLTLHGVTMTVTGGDSIISLLNNFVAIDRACRNIQNTQGRYKPLQYIKELREEQEKEYREEYS